MSKSRQDPLSENEQETAEGLKLGFQFGVRFRRLITGPHADTEILDILRRLDALDDVRLTELLRIFLDQLSLFEGKDLP